MEFGILSIVRKSVEKIQVSLKADKNNTHFTWKHESLWQYFDKFFLEWEMFYTSCRENQNTHFVFNNFFFPNIVSCTR